MNKHAEGAALEAQGIAYGYEDENPVLRGVDIRFESGTLTGVIGPNGSGKTTLIKILSGALQPSSGVVRLKGRDINSYTARELARNMSVVPQSSHIEFDMTALDIALMGRQPYIRRFERESPADLGIAREALRRTDVLRYENTPVTALSGGEMQRVVIARALTQQAGVMLLDEPVSSLDISHASRILRLTRDLVREDGVCGVCVLHDLSLAGWFCDKIALMHGGRVFAYGRPEEVLTGKNILAVYGVPADIIIENGRVRVLPRYE